MGKARKSRTRRHRRLYKQRMRSGRKISNHKLKTGRTGQVGHKRMKSLKDKSRKMGARPNEFKVHVWQLIAGKYVRVL